MASKMKKKETEYTKRGRNEKKINEGLKCG
jgi:hypothetical protein